MSLNEKIFYYALNDMDFLPNINISTNYKHWISKEDVKRCLNCAKMHGKIWYLNDEMTIDKPLHPNCRCEIETMQTIHGETVVLMSRVEGKYPRKPSNTAVFGFQWFRAGGDGNRSAVTYLWRFGSKSVRVELPD